MQDSHAAGKACCHVAHLPKLVRARKPEHARRLLFIHKSLDVRKELRGVLNLVYENRRSEALQKESRILPGKPAVFQDIQGNIGTRIIPAGLEEGRLPCPAWACHEHNREKVGSFPYSFFKSSRDIHGASD